jgi:hypothetical protein
LLRAQALEHEGRVRGVQTIELLLELDGVLPFDERLHERMLARIRARHELIDERLPLEQGRYGLERRVQCLVMLALAHELLLRSTVRELGVVVD